MKSLKYRSKFEESVGNVLDKRRWKYEPYGVDYLVPRTYIPDFVSGSIMIEVKGYFRVGDTQKYKAVRDSNPKKELVFVLYNPDKVLRKGAKMTMSQWCEKEGFRWYTLENVHELNA